VASSHPVGTCVSDIAAKAVRTRFIGGQVRVLALKSAVFVSGGSSARSIEASVFVFTPVGGEVVSKSEGVGVIRVSLGIVRSDDVVTVSPVLSAVLKLIIVLVVPVVLVDPLQEPLVGVVRGICCALV